MTNPIFDGLRNAIDKWVGAEVDDFGLKKKLSDIWVEKKGVVTPYQPNGALRLIDKIQKEPVFKNNQRAQDLETGHFGAGRIETFGNLLDHLSA
jgi:hypothetical protein